MTLADESPVRKLMDQVLRQSLPHPEHLQAFLRQAVPHLADGFDCSRARPLDREFPMEDWRHRESDLPFEIPYRLGERELWALVYLLIEHQSDTDPLMPLRLLYFVVTYWDKKWHQWEQQPRPKKALKLPPVLPIVLYTGPLPWGSNRTIADLLDEPAALHAFAPAWNPLFWNLADQTPEGLLQTGQEWLQTLAVIRAETFEREEFATVFRAVLGCLEGLHGCNPVRWYDLMRIVLTWAYWRRPREERAPLIAAARASNDEVVRQREILTMVEKMSVTYEEEFMTKVARMRDEILRLQEEVQRQQEENRRAEEENRRAEEENRRAEEENRRKQEENRRAEEDILRQGERRASRSLLRMLLQNQIGPLPEALLQRIEATDDLEVLQRAVCQAPRLENLGDLQL